MSMSSSSGSSVVHKDVPRGRRWTLVDFVDLVLPLTVPGGLQLLPRTVRGGVAVDPSTEVRKKVSPTAVRDSLEWSRPVVPEWKAKVGPSLFRFPSVTAAVSLFFGSPNADNCDWRQERGCLEREVRRQWIHFQGIECVEAAQRDGDNLPLTTLTFPSLGLFVDLHGTRLTTAPPPWAQEERSVVVGALLCSSFLFPSRHWNTETLSNPQENSPTGSLQAHRFFHHHVPLRDNLRYVRYRRINVSTHHQQHRFGTRIRNTHRAARFVRVPFNAGVLRERGMSSKLANHTRRYFHLAA